LRSYSSIYNVGHRALAGLFDGPVIVEEKVDGSQFSFGLGTDDVLRARSKGAEINLEAPKKMLSRGVETVKALQAGGVLTPGWTSRRRDVRRGSRHQRIQTGLGVAGSCMLTDYPWKPSFLVGIATRR
jgi:hypothetical protein